MIHFFMTKEHYLRPCVVGLLVATILLFTGCVGWPISDSVVTAKLVSRNENTNETNEVITIRDTYRNWYVISPFAIGVRARMVDSDYFLQHSGDKFIELPFLHLSNQRWQHIVDVPATLKWVAISYPHRKGNYDIIDIVVFETNQLIHRRSLSSRALEKYINYDNNGVFDANKFINRSGDFKQRNISFLAFSRSRLAIAYRSDSGYEQYNILDDRIIVPSQYWWEHEKWEGL